MLSVNAAELLGNAIDKKLCTLMYTQRREGSARGKLKADFVGSGMHLLAQECCRATVLIQPE